MTTREILASFKVLYVADVAASLISIITGSVIGQTVEWQSSQLDSVKP